jgi:hypothetical protein
MMSMDGDSGGEEVKVDAPKIGKKQEFIKSLIPCLSRLPLREGLVAR